MLFSISQMRPFIHLFNKYLLSPSDFPYTPPGVEDTTMNIFCERANLGLLLLSNLH